MNRTKTKEHFDNEIAILCCHQLICHFHCRLSIIKQWDNRLLWSDYGQIGLEMDQILALNVPEIHRRLINCIV